MRRLPNTYPGDITKYPTGRGTFSIGSADEGSKVLFYNETPVNLDLDFYNGNTDVLHAWEANFWTLDGEVGDITWAIDTDSLTVTNPPINAVFATVLNPNETLRDKAYPMPLIRQIGGQQAIVSGASSLSNESNPINTLVIDIGDTALSQLWKVFSDHFSISVDQSGVAHTVLQGNAAGNPLKMGQAGDVVEFLGGITIDSGNFIAKAGVNTWQQIIGESVNFNSCMDLTNNNGTVKFPNMIFANGGLTFLNAVYLQMLDHLGTARGVLGTDASDNTLARIAGASSQFQVLTQAGVEVLGIDASGLNISSKKLFDTAGNNLADWSAVSGLFMKGGVGGNGPFNYQGNHANTDWQLGAACKFSGSGTVTVNHTMVQFNASVAPDWVAPVVNVAGSATMGYDTVTSTQVHITAGAALGWHAWGLK